VATLGLLLRQETARFAASDGLMAALSVLLAPSESDMFALSRVTPVTGIALEGKTTVCALLLTANVVSSKIWLPPDAEAM
jgi:hypothetical protein